MHTGTIIFASYHTIYFIHFVPFNVIYFNRV